MYLILTNIILSVINSYTHYTKEYESLYDQMAQTGIEWMEFFGQTFNDKVSPDDHINSHIRIDTLL
ncbi:MAG: hypothetical protein QM644_09320 [Mobilitalea sp.]